MNKLQKLKQAGGLGVLALSLAGAPELLGQDAEGKIRIGEAEGRAEVDLPGGERDRDRLRSRVGTDSDTRAKIYPVQKVNKASDLVGMDVRNHQDEKLGDIKDIVLDLESGKVAYVVLSVGGFLGIGDKLIAIPPSAFKKTLTNDGLLLDADRVRIESAPGFVQTSWPNVNDPQFSAYWQAKQEAAGGADKSEVGKDRSSEREKLDREPLSPRSDDPK